MCCSCLSGTIIILDKICDFIPFVSTATNLVDLVAKIALNILKCVIPCAYKAIKDFAPIQHLRDKKAGACVFLAIPFVNFSVAKEIHIPKRFFSDSTSNQNQNQNVEEEPQLRHVTRPQRTHLPHNIPSQVVPRHNNISREDALRETLQRRFLENENRLKREYNEQLQRIWGIVPNETDPSAVFILCMANSIQNDGLQAGIQTVLRKWTQQIELDNEQHIERINIISTICREEGIRSEVLNPKILELRNIYSQTIQQQTQIVQEAKRSTLMSLENPEGHNFQEPLTPEERNSLRNLINEEYDRVLATCQRFRNQRAAA